MTPAISAHRPRVVAGLQKLISDSAVHLDRVNAWAPDLRTRLLDFASRGKLIRGSLVAVGAEVCGADPDEDLYRVAAAMELVQSFLLIHDDIMDEDHLRRGQPSIFEQYRQLGQTQGYGHVARFGESMGICAGDVAMLLGYEGLATTRYPAELQRDLMLRLSSEIADVGVAQMADVANGHSGRRVTEEEILAVYRYKTGRYTFSLPLSLGALIAGARDDQIRGLSLWGELQGTIFQIRDDQLGLLEDDERTGKPAGSDIAADKQTLHRLLLAERAAGTEREHVLGCFGQRDLPPEGIRSVRDALQELGVLAEIDRRVRIMDAESEQVLQSLDTLPAGGLKTLKEIASYNRGRRE